MDAASLLLRGLVGAGLISFVGAWSDRVHPYLGSLLAAVPTTSAVTLLFMALDHSPAFAAEAALWSLVTQIGNVAFALAFALLAVRASPGHPLRVPAAASLTFIAVAAPFVWAWDGRTPTLAVQGGAYLAFALLALAFRSWLLRRPLGEHAYGRAPARSRHLQRAILGGGLVMLALALADAAGPTWGGLFSSFPATFLTLLVVTYRHRSLPYFLEQSLALVPNTMALAAYIVTVHLSYPRLGVLAGTLLGYAVFAAVAAPLAWWRIRQHLHPDEPVAPATAGPEQG